MLRAWDGRERRRYGQRRVSPASASLAVFVGGAVVVLTAGQHAAADAVHALALATPAAACPDISLVAALTQPATLTGLAGALVAVIGAVASGINIIKRGPSAVAPPLAPPPPVTSPAGGGKPQVRP